LKSLLTNSENADIKPLKGRPELRLRIGDYRCLFFIDQENRIYIITQIGTRGDIYKK
jgi:mRNA interferase RelE/StbE